MTALAMRSPAAFRAEGVFAPGFALPHAPPAFNGKRAFNDLLIERVLIQNRFALFGKLL